MPDLTFSDLDYYWEGAQSALWPPIDHTLWDLPSGDSPPRISWTHGPVRKGDAFVEIDEFGSPGDVWYVEEVVSSFGSETGMAPSTMRRAGSTKKVPYRDLMDLKFRRRERA